jgi:parvulin-like peptidyl-prolyl isomerase
MKTFWPLIACLAGLFGLAAAAPKPPRTPPKPGSKRPAPRPASRDPLPTKAPRAAAVVTVNDEPVPVGDYLDELAFKWGPNALELLVQDALVRQEAKRRGIAVSDSDVAAEVEAMIREHAQDLGGQKELEKSLQERGWSMADYRTVLHRDGSIAALRQKIRRQIGAEVQFKDDQIEEEYKRRAAVYNLPDQLEISHILLRRDPAGDARANAAARARAQAALDRIRSAGGSNFAEVAAQVSQDASSAKSGGKLPRPIRRDAQPFGKDFDVAFEGQPGLVDRILESPAGYHVVRIDRRLPARVVPLAEVRDSLRREMIERETEARMAALWAVRRQDARVDRRLKY